MANQNLWLPKDLAERLDDAAKEKGLDPKEFVRDLLSAALNDTMRDGHRESFELVSAESAQAAQAVLDLITERDGRIISHAFDADGRISVLAAWPQ
jgi:hypothetical protein